MIKGVGKDTPTIVNEQGGKQSYIPYAVHLIDPKALLAVASVMAEGANKYERDNWRKIPCEEHLNHAFVHALAYLAGDTQDEHLPKAATRLLMALAVSENSQTPTKPRGLTDRQIMTLRHIRDYLNAPYTYHDGASEDFVKDIDRILKDFNE